MPELYLYAELLIHIRQLTLYAALRNPKNTSTKILLSSDKKTITALYEGDSVSVYLPTQISGTANVSFPTERRTELCARLVFDEEGESELEDLVKARGEGVEVPWGAEELNEKASGGFEVKCKECENVLLAEGKVKQWKDLPSANWADLMDLWFCHKPHEDGQEEASGQKGFGMKSKLGVEPGVGLVDALSLLVHQSDCEGVRGMSREHQTTNGSSQYDTVNPSDASDLLPNGDTKSVQEGSLTNSTQPTSQDVVCRRCSSFLGSLSTDPIASSSYRLFKSRLSIRSTSYPCSTFIGAQLLNLIESSISRRVIIHPNTSSNSSTQPGILAWIFNPDIYYTSSHFPTSSPSVVRAMKVFYQIITDPITILDSASSQVEELLLPQPEYDSFKAALEASTEIMPASVRLFPPDKADGTGVGVDRWHVGLIERWEKEPSGRKVMDGNCLNKKAEVGDDGKIKMQMNEVPEGWKELFA